MQLTKGARWAVPPEFEQRGGETRSLTDVRVRQVAAYECCRQKIQYPGPALGPHWHGEH